MKKTYKMLSYSLKWLSFESLIYHAIFITHQLFLFTVTGYKTYGVIGALFSITYLLVTITSFGLESSLSPFFKAITQNQKTFKACIIPQIIPTIILSTLTIPTLLLLKHTQKYIFLQQLNYPLICILSLLILSESIKKTFRGILYMAFKNKTNMLIEITSLLIYISSIWLYYFATKKITIGLVFIPMAITSLLSCAILAYFVYQLYKTLPQNTARVKQH
ncbi:hypothetical protein ACFLYU_04900 [Candidatus Dependentiae bacterium]